MASPKTSSFETKSPFLHPPGGVVGVGQKKVQINTSRPCYTPKAVKVRDRKLQNIDAGFRGLNDKISRSFFESPDIRKGAEAPALTHQQKPPINSCVRDENAIRSLS